MSDALLILGGIVFQGFEVPEQITGLGGEQMLVVNRLIGGRRVIDAMGEDPTPRSWSGRFRGGDALARARAVDELRRAGQAVDLSFGAISETVVVRRFIFNVLRFYEVTYEITLEVVADDFDLTSGPGVDEMITSDTLVSSALGGLLGDTALSGFIGDLDTAVGAVSQISNAPRAVLANILQPVEAVQSRVNTLVSSVSAKVGALTSIGGLI